MADTKITRLRNLLTPMKNYIAMVNANKRGESISTLLLDRELENINKYSDEIWAIIAEIPNDACEEKKPSEKEVLPLCGVSGCLYKPDYINWQNKYFKPCNKVYDFQTIGKDEFFSKEQLHKKYEKAMLESPFK